MGLDNVDILLVEDNPYDAELTVISFQRAGIADRVLHVRSVTEASDYIFPSEPGERGLDGLPRLILLDIKLPRVDGLELVKRIRSDPNTRPIPIVALTSSREKPNIVDCYRTGVNSYIVKPVDFEKFVQVIDRLACYWLKLNRVPS